MASPPDSSPRRSSASQRDADRELIDAWFKGTGATVVVVFFVIAGLAFAAVTFSDSPALALLIVAAVVGVVAAKKQGVI